MFSVTYCLAALRINGASVKKKDENMEGYRLNTGLPHTGNPGAHFLTHVSLGLIKSSSRTGPRHRVRSEIEAV